MSLLADAAARERLGGRLGGHALEPVSSVDPSAQAVLLADADAWARVRELRDAGVAVPCVVLTDGPPPADRPALEPVVLLRSGQDPERALDRLGAERSVGVLHLEGGALDLDRAVFDRSDGRSVKLSGQEWLLLSYLAARSTRVIEREELQLQVWDYRRPVPSRAVDMAVSRLRKKIEPDPAQPVSLVTIRNAGYRLAVAERAESPPGFVGRVRELGDVARALLEGVVTVSGAPGVGKSRTTAIACARCGNVVRVELAGVDRVERAATALSVALGLPVRPVQEARAALESALDAVPPRSVVLWDHADDVPGLVGLLEDLGRPLQAVTIRRAPPEARSVVALGPLPPHEARALLVLNAASPPDPEGLDALVDLVDGLPLAIELAAAWIPRLGAGPLAAVLSGVGGALAGLGPALTSAIEASWMRLGPDEQEALSRLSRFRAAFPLDDGLEVSGASGDTWMALVDGHLVVRDGERFRVLHAVAAFVAHHHGPSDLDARFVACIAARAEAGVRGLEGARAREAFTALTSRLTDLWTAWDLARAARDPDAVATLCHALVRILGVRGGTEGERLAVVEAALPVVSGTSAEPLVRLLRAEVWSRPRIREARDEFEWVARHGDGDLAVRAELHAARLVNWIDGNAAARARIAQVPTDRGTVTTQLRRRVQELTYADVGGVLSPEVTTPELVSIADELYAMDAVAEAVYAGLFAGDRLRVMQPERAGPFLERVLGWADSIEDPQGRIDVRITYSSVLGDSGEEGRAFQLLGEAERLVQLFQPMRAFQIRDRTGALHIHAGRTDEARAAFLEVLAWARRTRSVAPEHHALLELISVEVDAGQVQAGIQRALDAVEATQVGGATHIVHQAWLCAALAHFMASQRAEAAAWLEKVDADVLSRVSQLQRLSLMGDLDALDAMARSEGGRRGAELSGIFDAARRGDAAYLAGWLASPKATRFGVELRLLVRIWLHRVSPRNAA
ncbi:MAG: winged helix-turn-helix domain-containing protein [Myxococcota bacterium]